MKKLTIKEMEDVQGGLSLVDMFGGLFGNNTPKTPDTPSVTDDPFTKNMKKMFGASAGRNLAKLAQKYKVVDVVKSIFGW